MMTPAERRIWSLAQELLVAAQGVYDEWDQDENGEDPWLGTGGICDGISQAMAEVLSLAGIDSDEGGQDGDDHSFLVATLGDVKILLDIPPGVYERGSGYVWKKIQGVKFSEKDLTIYEL